MRKASLIVFAVAALQGLGGVVLAAAAAHVESNPLLATASNFLSLHAAAAFGAAAFGRTLERPSAAFFALVGVQQFGVTLFAADLALRALGPGRLFPYAAPIGGSITILAWAGLAIWTLLMLSRQHDEGS